MSLATAMRMLEVADLRDWSDLEGVHARAATLARTIAADRDALAGLFERVSEDAALWKQSESLSLDDKIVLYDGLEGQGFRLRLHLSTSQNREVPHDHRFALTTLILSGGYLQRIYAIMEERPVTSILRWEEPGSCYTLHQDTIHSNIAKAGTALLIVRGPTEKVRATGLDLSTGASYEKLGAADEPESTARAHRMTRDRFRQVRRRLQELALL